MPQIRLAAITFTFPLCVCQKSDSRARFQLLLCLTLRHNNIRDITASMLTEVCHNVRVEPELQPLTGEEMQHKTANMEEGVRLDIHVSGFWGNIYESAFFDVRVFNLYALSK